MQFCADAFAAEFGGICCLLRQQRHRQADSACCGIEVLAIHLRVQQHAISIWWTMDSRNSSFAVGAMNPTAEMRV
jgi:hypothetical protein